MNPDNGRCLAALVPASAAGTLTRRPNGSPTETTATAASALRLLAADLPLDLNDLLQDIERGIIVRALARSRGNQKEAARLLGLKYTTLNEKVKRHGIRFWKSPLP